jgi:hypothetical protein
MFFYFFSLVGVLSFESIVLWPVWCSSFSASQGVALSAGCLAIFLLSVSACDWGVRFIGLDKVILLFKTLWLNAESSVSSIADLDGVLNLLGLDEILGIWSASGAPHRLGFNTVVGVVSVANRNDFTGWVRSGQAWIWLLGERALSWLLVKLLAWVVW